MMPCLVTLWRREVRCSTENCSFWNLSSSSLCFSTAYFSRRFSCFTCSRVTQCRALLSVAQSAQYPHELLLGPPQLLRPPREVVLALVRPRPRHRRPRPGLGAGTEALLQLLRKLGPEQSYMIVTLITYWSETCCSEPCLLPASPEHVVWLGLAAVLGVLHAAVARARAAPGHRHDLGAADNVPLLRHGRNTG